MSYNGWRYGLVKADHYRPIKNKNLIQPLLTIPLVSVSFLSVGGAKPKQMSRESLIKKWTEENKPIGEALGYPDCCIKEFCQQPPQLLKGNPTKDDKRRLKAAYVNGVYTGFIPCSEHAKQIVQGKITLESLIDKEKRANNDEYYIPEFPNAMQ